jgi:chemotaxis protein methyltransferase CheR
MKEMENHVELQPYELDVCSELEKLEIELLLNGIYRYYGHDFRNYAFSSIRRRIWHRIQIEKLHTVSALLERVLHDPSMMEKLFFDFSINVTEMFRDPSFFLAFRRKVVPLLEDLPFIRIWHAGCSTGEEAYSMAILLHEENLLHKTRIYATDINENVLEKAKTGCFPLNRMKMYTGNYVASGGKRAFSEYYKVEGAGVLFHSFLAENITFAPHNLATDSSFNEFHIIICRNVLIYFDKHLQGRVHKLFFDSLSPGGILGLGSREALATSNHHQLYEVVDENEKLYHKIITN